MRVRIFQPSDIFLDTTAKKIVAESPAGSFTILPRHIDLATTLVPSILMYETEVGEERFLALDEGILVKQGDRVSISTMMAVRGELGALEEAVERFLEDLDEGERKTRSAIARLEADFVRRIVGFGKNAH